MKIIITIIFVLSFIFAFSQEKKEYFESGKIKCIYFLKNDKKQGKYVEFHQNGQIKLKGKYNKGIEIGRWVCFSKSGVILGETFYNRKGDIKKRKTINPAYK